MIKYDESEDESPLNPSPSPFHMSNAMHQPFPPSLPSLTPPPQAAFISFSRNLHHQPLPSFPLFTITTTSPSLPSCPLFTSPSPPPLLSLSSPALPSLPSFLPSFSSPPLVAHPLPLFTTSMHPGPVMHWVVHTKDDLLCLASQYSHQVAPTNGSLTHLCYIRLLSGLHMEAQNNSKVRYECLPLDLKTECSETFTSLNQRLSVISDKDKVRLARLPLLRDGSYGVWEQWSRLHQPSSQPRRHVSRIEPHVFNFTPSTFI
ncbi:hypothetical protein Pcinc_014365 [Petrolisthes cinctipes]|uniref:Uncharacterized protein n=1 Tax=Petrolisthes cinctipes TaxID=88211 RepID=A0AAE1FWK2_PETCI|nr:hypothetical protein Pcinc_014365 [Petrolisthes cinctipes]